MKRALEHTWIVVTDAGSAHFYTLVETDRGLSIETAAESMISGIQDHAADLKSDKPGRSFASAGGGVRHSIEPHHDYHKLEKHDFTHAVAAFLEHAFDAHKFERLVVVAPDRSVGELRSELPDKVRRVVWREILKDFTKLNPQDLWTRLGPLLAKEA